MSTMNREDLIGKIVSSRVQDILVPSTVFGRPMLVKTTKKDIVARIRETYAENATTNLKFRLRPRTNTAIVEPIVAFDEFKPEVVDATPVRRGRPRKDHTLEAANVNNVPHRGRGRPKGSKNKPKAALDHKEAA